MTVPESRPDIESTLADAFSRRHARQGASRPSLVDVRRRAHRRSSRRAGMRGGAAVVAGVAVLAGGWAITRGSTSPSAVPAGPVPGAELPPGTPIDVAITSLSVDDLWAAVATQLGTTVDELRMLNPTIDFSAAPQPDTPIVSPARGDDVTAQVTVPGPGAVTTAPPGSVIDGASGPGAVTTAAPMIFDGAIGTTTIVTAPPTTGLDGATGTTTTSTWPAGESECSALTDEQLETLAGYARSLPRSGEATPPTLPGIPAACQALPPVPEGWTLYQIVPGDYVVKIAEQFCTTADAIVVGNGWPDLNQPIHPYQLISVPADAC